MHGFGWGFFKVLVTIALFWGGGHMIWSALSNRSVTQVTAAELFAKHPSATWLEITHARLGLADPCYLSPAGTSAPTEVLIPILPPAGQAVIFIPAFLHSRKKEYLDPAKKMVDLDDTTVSGVVETGIALEKATLNAAETHYGAKALGKFLVIEDGEKPSWLKGLGLLALGLVALWWTLGGFESRPEESTSTDLAVGPPPPPAG